MRLIEHERQVALMLKKAGVESPGLCARRLLEKTANLSNTAYLLAARQRLTSRQIEMLEALTARRLAGEPLAYILGEQGFYDHIFKVNSATLIPRPETEMLVDMALKICVQSDFKFADLGCGCGCIGLSILAKRPQWLGFLVDNSPSALAVAKSNAAIIFPGAVCIRADIFNLPFASESLDLIVSNPPYIGHDEKNEVDRETLAWEPHFALFSEQNGLSHLHAIIRSAWRILRPGGALLLEHGWQQKNDVLELLAKYGFGQRRDFPDLAGHDRCSMGIKIKAGDTCHL